jgi:DsbC/DsbD-like thiol-disulfide interchange protein
MRFTVFPIAISLGISLALAAAAPASPPTAKTVTVTTDDTLEVRTGATAEARVHVTVESGFHVQSNPPSASYLIATQLKLNRMPGVTPGKVKYPKGTPYKLEGSDETLTTYSGSFDLVVPVRVSRAARPGGGALKGTLRYQACDEHACYAPTTATLSIPVRVVKGR